MAYDHWTSTIFEYNNKCDSKNKITIEIPEDEKNKFIRSSIYGGRVTCYTKEYKSNTEFKNYQELINSKDFMFNADVSSLYPTALAGNDY